MNREDAIRKAIAATELAKRAETPGEAAAAAAAAQRIMLRHKLEAKDLEEADPGQVGYTATRISARRKWRVLLAIEIAQANGCKIFTWGSQEIAIAGRPAAREFVRYLTVTLCAAIDRLAQGHRGGGVRWLNSYRLGAVLAIAEAIEASRARVLEEAPAERAVLCIDQALVEADRWAADFCGGDGKTQELPKDLDFFAAAVGRSDARDLYDRERRVKISEPSPGYPAPLDVGGDT